MQCRGRPNSSAAMISGLKRVTGPVLALLLTVVAVQTGLVPSSGAGLRGSPAVKDRLWAHDTDEGLALENLSTRIVGGQVVPEGSRPFQAAVYVDNDFLCAGVLIDPEWVLTGAQCVYEGTLMRVGLGIYNLTGTNDGRQIFTITNYSRHANFSFSNMHNDIALLRLPTKAVLGDAVQPVALPTSSDALGVGVNLTASGWGTLNDDSTYAVPIPHEVTVPTISNEDCVKTFGAEIVNNGTLCTSGQGGMGPCIGDAGGPLTNTAADGTMSLAGLISFGHVGGCQQGDPDGYTRISYYLDWIQEHMKSD